ncbi:hypothetical protein SAMN04487893_11528 [Myroides guanonis]|uniref:Uncharacterized protein n=2 Tax=Myroides guanonis TaxID=1150112 RepID=A0A1I3U035_9FLAO|nr:hypothetical protein SAMN04487893_11528 [Myroides guanonis]
MNTPIKMKLSKLYFSVLQLAQKNLQTQVGWVQLWIDFQKVELNKSSPKSSLFNGLWRQSLWEQRGVKRVKEFMRPV